MSSFILQVNDARIRSDSIQSIDFNPPLEDCICMYVLNLELQNRLNSSVVL